MAHSSGVLGSASTETCRLFKVNETMLPPLAVCLYWRSRMPMAAADRARGRLDWRRTVAIAASLASEVAVSHRKNSKQPDALECYGPGSRPKVQCGSSAPI